MDVVELKTKKPRTTARLGIESKKPSGLAGLLCVVSHTRKIDMMWLIYDHFATTSSGINEDLFPVEYLGRADDCSLFQRLQTLGNSGFPAAAR